MSDVGSNSDTGSHTHDPTHPSSGIEGQGASLVEDNPWFPLCASRLSALDDPKIPLLEVKDRFEQELRWIEEARSVIKSRLNMLCPIARLSPEVLAHVFRFLTDIDWPVSDKIFGVAYIGWISVSYVCRSWRNVALDYPDLWGRGNICSAPNWMNERLRRSKEAPFDVVIHHNEKVPRSVFANAHRLGEVSISPLMHQYSDRDMEATASHLALLSLSAPSLVSFSYRYINQSPGNHLKLPDNIFACNAPRLTDLWLENTTLTFHASVFDNLIHLCLKFRNSTTGGDEDIPLNRNQLLELLLRIPKLETLMLEGKIHNPSEDIESQSDVDGYQPGSAPSFSVPLPQLRKLALGHDPWSWLWLAERLSIPATASFWMYCRTDFAVQDQASVCDAFLPFMIRHLEKGHSRSTQLLRVMCGSRVWRLMVLADLTDTLLRDVGILPYVFDGHFMERTVSAPIDFAFTSDIAPVIPVMQVLRPLLAKIYTNNIEVLQIYGTASHLDCPEWLRLFASFTALKRLSIYGMIASNLMQALGLDLTINLEPTAILGDTSFSGPQVLFPALRSLEFLNVDFTRFVDTADARLSDIATAALIERREMNRALEEISLEKCHFRRHWVDGLRSIGFRCTCTISESMAIQEEYKNSLYPLYDEEACGRR